MDNTRLDDLTLVHDLGADTPLPTAADLDPVRQRLVAGITRQRTSRRRSRIALGGTTIGVAAAAAAVVAFSFVGGDPPAPSTATGQATAPPVTDPVRLLAAAAKTARAQTGQTPRPDQFVYTRTGDRETWFSVDGKHDSLMRRAGRDTPVPGCRGGVEAVVKGDDVVPGQFQPCEVRPAYRSDLPTTTEAMITYLADNASGEPGDINARGKDILGLATESMLPPATRAALYEAAAQIPGLTVIPSTQDGAGRPGVGITWTQPEGDPGSVGVVMVFDPTTHQFLGTNFDSMREPVIVDQPGQRP
ncbi:CU044_5270 family protein [Actinokineospora auranticolor]|uniref:Uncharacterized protein n=1 Tax=Actinokineospora auranticolor TaxID=155976 RepID=A0A2S6GJ13_9PSEU|nr:CU044_5270 family protein [Actinokineospora auranticolor]PPK65190.1 hypothetical protein CLV40_11537 [Actinokineospora auranticolor]